MRLQTQPESWIYVHIWLNNNLIKLYFKDVKKTTGWVGMIHILAFSELVEKVTHLGIFDHVCVFLLSKAKILLSFFYLNGA